MSTIVATRAGRPARAVRPIALALLVVLPLSACTGSGKKDSGSGVTAPASGVTSPAEPSGSAPTSTVESSTAAPTPPLATHVPSIVVPPHLCSATDRAQDAADAYMGSLSAGQEAEAVACVYPNTVPASTTKALVAHQSGTAVYLPESGAGSGNTFGYVGGGKRIRVTVTKEPDGKYWVTGVSVR